MEGERGERRENREVVGVRDWSGWVEGGEEVEKGLEVERETMLVLPDQSPLKSPEVFFETAHIY